MCLCIVPNDRKVKRATRDKVVYKVVYEVGNNKKNGLPIFSAPYQNFYYTLNKLSSVRYFSGTYRDYAGSYQEKFFITKIPNKMRSVDRGLHCYSTLQRAKRAIPVPSRLGVVKCIIPKGTPYINGDDSEIVCLKLIPKKVLTGAY